VPTLSGAHHLFGLSALAAANLHFPFLILVLVNIIQGITLTLFFSRFVIIVTRTAVLKASCGGGAGGTSSQVCGAAAVTALGLRGLPALLRGDVVLALLGLAGANWVRRASTLGPGASAPACRSTLLALAVFIVGDCGAAGRGHPLARAARFATVLALARFRCAFLPVLHSNVSLRIGVAPRLAVVALGAFALISTALLVAVNVLTLSLSVTSALLLISFMLALGFLRLAARFSGVVVHLGFLLLLFAAERGVDVRFLQLLPRQVQDASQAYKQKNARDEWISSHKSYVRNTAPTIS
jgi:hypothetical protein